MFQTGNIYEEAESFLDDLSELYARVMSIHDTTKRAAEEPNAWEERAVQLKDLGYEFKSKDILKELDHAEGNYQSLWVHVTGTERAQGDYAIHEEEWLLDAGSLVCGARSYVREAISFAENNHPAEDVEHIPAQYLAQRVESMIGRAYRATFERLSMFDFDMGLSESEMRELAAKRRQALDEAMKSEGIENARALPVNAPDSVHVSNR